MPDDVLFGLVSAVPLIALIIRSAGFRALLVAIFRHPRNTTLVIGAKGDRDVMLRDIPATDRDDAMRVALGRRHHHGVESGGERLR
jgi:hypothetical protein